MPPVSVTIFASDPGTYFLEDDGIPGNNFSRIRFPNGTVVAFEHPTNGLVFDPSVAGVTLVVNLTDSLGTANFLAGVFGDALSSPDFIQVRNLVTAAGVTLVANNAITEFGSDAAPDIVASTLIMSATTGVGTASNALETQVGVIEAETNTGGINLRNFGTVAIGGLTADVDGLDVLTSGDLLFTNFGSIVISDDSGPESIHGGTTSGNVTLIANGIDSDMIANVDQDSISAPRGNITLTAGRDIGFGLIGANFDNDIRASGTITFNPGRDLLLDGFADVASDNFGNATGGNVIVNAGRNITLLAVAGTDAGIEASGTSGADIILNTGPGGTVTLNSGNGTAPFASLISQTGDIIVNADRMSIGINGAISTVNGTVTIRPLSQGWDINLGSATDAAFALELSDAEIDRIFTTTLNVGSLTSGQLTVSSAISPLHALNLALNAGTDLNLNTSLTVGGSLTLRAGDNLFQLGASAINIGGDLTGFVDQAGDDAGTGGFATLNGSVAATSTSLRGSLDRDTLNGTGSDDTLFGFGNGDTLNGYGGNDTIDGGAASDLMSGGLGDDTYFVDAAGDLVFEAAGEGSDTVITNVSYALDVGQEVELLRTFGSGTTEVINLSGNEFDNTLFGNAAANVLDGKVGADLLRGFGGDDTYFIDNAGDAVIEAVGGGNDTVITTVNLSLGGGQEVETLRTLGSGTAYLVNLTGNEFANTLLGNAAVNELDGGGGVDTLRGFAGDDTYYIDNTADVVIEAAAGGSDTVITNVHYTLGAGQHVEVLRTYGSGTTDSVKLVGNELANTILGNAAVNVLDGKGGNDSLRGFAGNDSFTFTSALGAGNVDTIVDFSHTDDTFVLDDAVFAGLALGALAAGAFRNGAAAADADDRIIYNGATGALFFDPDGVGGAAAIQFATLTLAPAINQNDFLVI